MSPTPLLTVQKLSCALKNILLWAATAAVMGTGGTGSRWKAKDWKYPILCCGHL